MSIDTTKIKAGDWPEGVSFICVDGDGYSEAHGDRFPWEPFTAHRPAITWDGVPHTNEDPDHTSEPAYSDTDRGYMTEPTPCPDCKGGESYRDCPACEGTGLASEPVPELERDPMCDAEWEHLLKTAQRGRIMEVGGLEMRLVEANDLLRQWRKLYDLGIEDFMPSFAHPVVGELYDKTMEYLTDEQPENLKPNITMKELEATNKAVEELTKPQSEKAPEVSVLEWLTEEDIEESMEMSWTYYSMSSKLNALLTRKLSEGKLPVVAKADVADLVKRTVLQTWTEVFRDTQADIKFSHGATFAMAVRKRLVHKMEGCAE